MTVLLVRLVLFFWRKLAHHNEDVAIGLIEAEHNHKRVSGLLVETIYLLLDALKKEVKDGLIKSMYQDIQVQLQQNHYREVTHSQPQ